MNIPNLRNMLIQYRLFFERQGAEVKQRGLMLLDIIHALLTEKTEDDLPYVANDHLTRKEIRDERLAAEFLKVGRKHKWKITPMARELNIARQTAYDRLRKFSSSIGAAAILVWACCFSGCGTTAAHYQGAGIATLINHPGFIKVAAIDPQFMTEIIRTVNQSEFELYAAKRKQYRPPCTVCYKRLPDGNWIKKKLDPPPLLPRDKR